MSKRNDDKITQGYIREATRYCEDTGMLYWREGRPVSHFLSQKSYRSYLTRYAGKVCGCWNERSDSKKDGFGYYVMSVQGKSVKMHRMVFLLHKGHLPEIVDHHDTNTRNCRIDNLRGAETKKNSYNQCRPSHNTTGFKGVSVCNNRKWNYKANIMKDGRTYNIGYYDVLEEATQAYNIVAEVIFGEFCKLNIVSFSKERVTKTSKFWREQFPVLVGREDCHE